MCKTKTAIREIQTEQEDFLGAIHVHTADTDHRESPWMTAIDINDRVLTFKIDTGADVTIISHSDYSAEKMAHCLLPVNA